MPDEPPRTYWDSQERIGQVALSERDLLHGCTMIAALLLHGRGIWEAHIPVDVLRTAPFPKLAVSGDQSPAAFPAICDALEQAVGAQRVVVPGIGHNGYELLGPVKAFFSDVVAADRAAPSTR